MPPPKTAVTRLAEALVVLQGAPIPGGISGPLAVTLDNTAPYLPFHLRFFLANRWLFDPILESVLSQQPTMNASMRTTTAPTMLSASVKENVLPIHATARVNLRLHPRDTPESVLQHFQHTLRDFADVEVTLVRGSAASPVSSTSSAGYQLLGQISRQVYGDVVVVPGLTVGGTDSKHFVRVADDAYRFNPMLISPDEASGFHGTNERISIDNLVSATAFYRALMESL